MTVCHVDIETYSEEDLKKSGVYKYAEHISTEVACCMYAFDDGPVNWWLPIFLPASLKEEVLALGLPGEIYFQQPIPDDLRAHCEKGSELRAHNAMFERVVLSGVAGNKTSFPKTSISQWVCTAVKAAAHSLPRALKELAIALDAPHKKDESARITMLQLAKPKKSTKAHPHTKYTPENAPEKYMHLFKYCDGDVETERACDKLIPDLPKRSQAVYEADQRINDRGVAVDMESVENVMFLVGKYKQLLEQRCVEITGFNPTQTGKLAEWIRDNGYPELKNLQAPTIKALVDDKEIPKVIREVAKIRATHSMKAVTKYNAIVSAACKDNRLRGMFLFFGASTGRWSSKHVQLQNLFRPVINDPNTAIEAYGSRDLNWVRTLYKEDPMRVFASTVRGVLVAGKGKDILCPDFNSIEARVLAWLAGQEDKLEVFRTHGMAYEHTASRIYNMPTNVGFLERMKKEYPDERFVGKTADLALGYQGGARALMGMAENYGVDIPEDKANQIKLDWRRAHPEIVSLWYSVQNAAMYAVASPGKMYKEGKLHFKVVGDFLYMRLPSGRRLAYFKPEINPAGGITFMGIDTYTRKWCRTDSYGGKLVENATQAVAADVMFDAVLTLEKNNYPIIGTVHDEVLVEVDENKHSLDAMCEMMCEEEEWRKGLPLAADGFRAKRYRK